MSLPNVPNPEVDRPQAPLRVLVVDDHPAVRDGLTRLLACAPMALRCVGAVGGSAEALEALVALRPDVVILDADLAGQDGLALIPRMAPIAGVLVLTSHGDPGTRARAGQLGALDFVEKHRPAAELFCAIERVARMKGGEEAPIPDCENSPPVLVTSSAAQSMRRP